ncbi:hypothetical protein RF55_19715, partial [Lasius niger]
MCAIGTIPFEYETINGSKSRTKDQRVNVGNKGIAEIPDDQPEMLPAEETAEQTTMEEAVELPKQSQEQIQPDEKPELQEEKPEEPELDNPVEKRNDGDEESAGEKGGPEQVPP